MILELFASSIAEQIIPILTNSMPVTLKINLENDEQRKNTTLYINDTTYESIPEEIVLASGVYNLTFVCPGFKTLGTSYFFEGGKTFNIDVNMQEELLSDITLNLKKPMIGSYLVNGISIPSEEGNEAIAMMMELEGIVLDTCYTGKAFAGLIKRARAGEYTPEDNVLFVHSGGAGGLFAQDWENL